MEKICDNCEHPFDAKRKSAKFCSDTCRVAKSRNQKTEPKPKKEAKPIENHVIIRKASDIDKAIASLPHGLKGGGLSKDQLAIRMKKLGY